MPPSNSVDAKLNYSLADAPLTSKERDQIYRLIDEETVHDSFTDKQRAEERETVMSSRVGLIGLAEDGSPQLLARGPTLFCGTGGCPYWVFIRQHGELQLVLEAFGTVLVRKTSSQGFRDVTIEIHGGGGLETFADYSWNGTKYHCKTASEYHGDSTPPVITGCADRP